LRVIHNGRQSVFCRFASEDMAENQYVTCNILIYKDISLHIF